MVQMWPRLHLYSFPPIALLLGVLERVCRDGVRPLLVALFLPGRVWFSDLISLLDGSPWEIPVRRDLLSQAGGTLVHPFPELWMLWVCGHWGGTAHSFWPLNRGCWDILQSRAPSTRKLYALKWRLFTSWCGDHQLDPVNCLIGTVLELLQDQLSTGLTHSTLKVYVAALPDYNAPLAGQSVGVHPLVTCFLRGWGLRPESFCVSGCYSIASSPLLSPFLGIKTHFSEVGLQGAGPTHFSHLWPFFSRFSCAPSTLGRDLSIWWRGHLVTIAFSDIARAPKEERLMLRL